MTVIRVDEDRTSSSVGGCSDIINEGGRKRGEGKEVSERKEEEAAETISAGM